MNTRYEDLVLPLTPASVEALSKTVGIALSNLARKMDHANPGTPMYDTAKRDRTELLQVQADLTQLSLRLDGEVA